MIKRILIGMMLLTSTAQTAEIDNWSLYDFHELDDSADKWNEHVNDVIQESINDWNPKWGNNVNKFVDKFWSKLEGNLIRGKSHFWAKNNMDHLNLEREESIYQYVPFSAAPTFAIFGVGMLINIGGMPVGYDKISHYLGAGKVMWNKAYKKGKGEAKAIKWAEGTEKSFLGLVVSGVFSNGDLVADYEGMRFLKALFDPSVFPEKGALLKFTEDGEVVQLRNYEIENYISPFWNEAINPSGYNKKTQAALFAALPNMCDQYFEYPEYYEISADERAALKEKYKMLPLRYNEDFLLERICN